MQTLQNAFYCVVNLPYGKQSLLMLLGCVANLPYGKQSLRMLVGCVANLPAKHGQIELFLRGFLL